MNRVLVSKLLLHHLAANHLINSLPTVRDIFNDCAVLFNNDYYSIKFDQISTKTPG